jgi:ABC transport system ATP-binding/permease protein
MLTVEALTYTLPGKDDVPALLENVSFALPPGHFMAIVGPSGCGKTTLLKIIAGLQTETSGRLLWRGEDLAEDGDLTASELGYVPQFSIAHDALTVGECVENAVRLRTTQRDEALEDLADEALKVTGLTALRDQRFAVLSGGQKRRLGLAMEWVSHPALLLCDEVTSGLDPESASEIVHLLHALSRHPGRSVVNVTHSLSDLSLYDSVLVLTGGRLSYHGPPDKLAHYFSVGDPGEIYPRLSQRPAGEWHDSWQKRQAFYYQMLGLPVTGQATLKIIPLPAAGADAPPAPPPAAAPAQALQLPGFFSQFQVLLSRRLTLFFRDRMQFFLHLALLFGFPLLVVLFAPHGIGALPESAGHSDLDIREAMTIQMRAVEGQSRLGGLISGLVMFQVILLTLMGANNASREIAGERLIYEKERLAGLRPGAYLLSKAVFLTFLVVAQSVWMAVFTDHFAQLPGPLIDRAVLLLLVNGAMTAVCLAISALLRSADQASLLSIYLVGFQLPLSGAVLALPEALKGLIQPFIAAYWSWSGQLAAMRPTDYFVAINRAIPTAVVSDPALPLTILGFHLAAGLIFAWIGCLRHQWD